MIRGGFLDPTIRADLITLVRNGKAETRLTRRANALLLLDDGMSCQEIAKVLYLDDDTIRYWYELYSEKGLSWLADFGYKGRACELTAAQQDALKNWVAQTLPRTTTMVGEWIEKILWRQLHPLGPDQALAAQRHGLSQARTGATQA
jgi:transposase